MSLRHGNEGYHIIQKDVLNRRSNTKWPELLLEALKAAVELRQRATKENETTHHAIHSEAARMKGVIREARHKVDKDAVIRARGELIGESCGEGRHAIRAMVATIHVAKKKSWHEAQGTRPQARKQRFLIFNALT